MPRSLSLPEEIELRRVAHGSVMIDPLIVARLRAVALVEEGPGGLRLTPLGRRRVDALPQAPLLKPQGAVPAISSVIASLLERADRRTRKNGAISRSASAGGSPHA
ncbi:hypothetical protein [Reyranella sp.]|uniref:hypothetical protein n=1 Tax=Reyranella sp. TaxID=1929291 RepID=UPI0037853283